jgi:hypothetical protein
MNTLLERIFVWFFDLHGGGFWIGVALTSAWSYRAILRRIRAHKAAKDSRTGAHPCATCGAPICWQLTNCSRCTSGKKRWKVTHVACGVAMPAAVQLLITVTLSAARHDSGPWGGYWAIIYVAYFIPLMVIVNLILIRFWPLQDLRRTAWRGILTAIYGPGLLGVPSHVEKLFR